MKKILRASEMDSLFGCAPSVLADDPSVIRIKNDRFAKAAAIGNACHELAANMVLGRDYDLNAVCDRHGLDETDDRENVARLMDYAFRAWHDLAQYFADPVAESATTGSLQVAESNPADKEKKGGPQEYTLTGTIDLASPAGPDKAIFLDWKSGYLSTGYRQQMATYAWLLWQHLGKTEAASITGVVVFLRHRYYRVIKWDAASLRQWEYDLVHNVLSAPDKYHPGKTCIYCDIFASCPARQAVAMQTIKEILGGGSATDATWWDRAKKLLAQLTTDNKAEPVVGETINDVMFRIRLLRQISDQAKAVLKEAVARVGPIPVGEDLAIGLRTVDVERLDSRKALNVLRSFLSDGQLAECCTVSLPKAMGLFSRRAGVKKGKEQRESLHEKLENAGAIRVQTTERLQEIKLSDVTTTEGSNDGETDDKPAEKSG